MFLGSWSNTIDSILLADLNGEFYFEYDAQTLKGRAYLTPYHPDYWVGDEYELLTIDQQLDVKLYAKSWFKLRTMPDLGQWPSLSFGGSLRPAIVYALEGVKEQIFLVQGGTEIKMHAGFNGTLISSDSIYIQPHHTASLTLHY